MKKALPLWMLCLACLTALASPSSAQELNWQQYRGYDVPFVPTPPEVVDEMLRLADIRAGDVLYDLGCGDGRIVIAAAKRFGIRAVGIDIDPLRIAESNANAAKEGVGSKVRFVQQDLFEADFREATVVTMYLLTSVNLRLRPKLLTDLRPGTRLVSHSFDMGDWLPDATTVVRLSQDNERGVHFWVVPANASGVWEWDLADGPTKQHFRFEAAQRFQALSGPVTSDGRQLGIYEIKLAGDIISFVLTSGTDGNTAASEYKGRIQGHTITGTVRPRGNARAGSVVWKATRDPKTLEPMAK